MEFSEFIAPFDAARFCAEYFGKLPLHIPGNALVGGGGGIALLAGLSGLFAPLPTILAFAVAVSPVPLMATARTDTSVITATSYSKAVLRVAAEMLGVEKHAVKRRIRVATQDRGELVVGPFDELIFEPTSFQVSRSGL